MRKFIIGVILLGATAAVADTPAKEEHVPRVRLGTHVHRDAEPKRVGDWTELADATPTSHGTEFVTLAGNVGPIRTLRIDMETGRVELRKVVVEFEDGKHATFHVDQMLTPRHPTARIDLGAPRRLASLAITTTPRPAGSYTVQGSPNRTSVNENVAVASR